MAYMSDSLSQEHLWQAVHAAYEARDLTEARRLLQHAESRTTCDILHHCNDEAYVKWLLEHQLIPAQNVNTADLSELNLQERQLQCDALNEKHRPACILEGTLPCDSPNTKSSD